MVNRFSSVICGVATLCGDGMVNVKQPVKNPRPRISSNDGATQRGTSRRVTDRDGFFNRTSQCFRIILTGPESLIRVNDPVHVASADTDYRNSARLALERHQAEGFLHPG